MSAAVCGTKRSFFEDIPSPSSPIPKRLCCSSSTSPIRLSLLSLIDQLRSVFPHMDVELLEGALEECGNDFDAAIKSLNELQSDSTAKNLVSAKELEENVYTDTLVNGGESGDARASENPAQPNSFPINGGEWINLFVGEMMSATSVDDARIRAARALETLEKSISANDGVEAATSNKENMHLNEQIEVLLRENTILKRAVAIQHERQKEYDDRNQELQHMKQLVFQYQEQLRTLEVNNYALTIHLKQAQQRNSIPGRFHPDVF